MKNLFASAALALSLEACQRDDRIVADSNLTKPITTLLDVPPVQTPQQPAQISCSTASDRLFELGNMANDFNSLILDGTQTAEGQLMATCRFSIAELTKMRDQVDATRSLYVSTIVQARCPGYQTLRRVPSLIESDHVLPTTLPTDWAQLTQRLQACLPIHDATCQARINAECRRPGVECGPGAQEGHCSFTHIALQRYVATMEIVRTTYAASGR